MIVLNITCPHCGMANRSELGTAEDVACIECGAILGTVEYIDGFIYVLSNPSLANTLKVGKTNRDVSLRAAELSKSTSMPTPFSIDAYFTSKSTDADERRVHEALSKYRINSNREFFQLSLKEAVEIISTICGPPSYICNRYKAEIVGPAIRRCERCGKIYGNESACPSCGAHWLDSKELERYKRYCPRCEIFFGDQSCSCGYT